MKWINAFKIFIPYIFLVGFTCKSHIHAQQQKIDSILKADISIDKKIDLLTDEVSKSRYDSNSLPYAKKAVALAITSKKHNNLATAYNTLGDYYYFNSHMDSAMIALKIAEKNVVKINLPFVHWSIMVTMGDVKSKENKLIESISFYLKSLNILDEVNPALLSDSKKIRLKGVRMVSLNQLSNLYRKLDNYDQALLYNTKAYNIAVKEINDTESASVILNNKGEILYAMGRYEKALSTGLEAKKLKIEANMPLRLLISSDLNIGTALLKLDSLNSALKKFNSVIVKADSIKNKPLLANGFSQRGLVYLSKGLFKKALEDCAKAKQITNIIKEPEIRLDACNCLYSANFNLGQHKESLKNYVDYTNLKDSIFNEKNIQKTTQLGLQYEFEKKEEAQRISSERKLQNRNYALVGASIITLFTFLGFLGYQKRQNYKSKIAEQEAYLKDQQILKLQQENKLSAMNNMIAGQEQERTRIAKDLHDGLGGLLSSVKSHYLATIENRNDTNVIEKTKTLIDNACTEVRRISHNMMPHALVISGLKDGLKDITERLEVAGYEVTLEINPLPKLEETKEVMVYRMVQEIVANIKKHAEAKSILIQLYSQGQEVFMTIEDDGKGFFIEGAKTKKGLGLKNIESRVAFLNGKISWDSEIGTGTTINISFPT